MARVQLKIQDVPPVPDQTGAMAYATPGSPSPARAMQERLLAQASPRPDRWPVGQRVALVVTASLALWTAILHATAQAVHAVV